MSVCECVCVCVCVCVCMCVSVCVSVFSLFQVRKIPVGVYSLLVYTSFQTP